MNCLTVTVKGMQKAFLKQLQAAGPLAFIKPFKLYRDAVMLGFSPLFLDAPTTSVNVVS